jgi:hypothetical protein
MIGRTNSISALVIALVISQPATIGAQTPASSDRIIVKDGTDVKLRFIEVLSSKTAHVGDPVTLELAENLRVNDVIVVREGAKAIGEITTAKKAGMLGKGGDLAIQLFYLKADDAKLKLRGTRGKEGDLSPLFMLKHGKNAEIPAGTTITAYVAEDTALSSSAPVGQHEQASGQVSLESEPAGGDIQVDGKFFGNTPAVLALAPGEHKIQVTSSGKTWEKTLTVSAGSKLVVKATLDDTKKP